MLVLAVELEIEADVSLLPIDVTVLDVRVVDVELILPLLVPSDEPTKVVDEVP